MFFNSIDFAIFLPIVFGLYWALPAKPLKYRNALLLVAGYFFYGYWDWRFLFLLIFSTWLDYFTGLKIHEAESVRGKKTWISISVLVNLGFLGVFKYYNFFVDSFANLLHNVGFNMHPSLIKVILPVGISFYTFHGLSYVFDIYYKRIKPTKNFVDYSLFVNFFPLLVAGPIERAHHLLPQVENPRPFDYTKAVDGLRQILWGLFKKMVIADNAAEFVNMAFNNPGGHSASGLLIGTILFSVQIYGDFSGYSDIALGTARLFGFELLRNFAYPYFSRDIAEFWRRWHISLSSWFRDYLYIPLGGSKGGTWMQVRNTFIIFLVSGFWHGANYTFIAWGALNAIYFLPLMLMKQNRKNLGVVAQNTIFPSVGEAFSILSTFMLTVLAFTFFRADNMSAAFSYIGAIFSPTLFSSPGAIGSLPLTCGIIFLFAMEWMARDRKHALENFEDRLPRPLRWALYYVLAFAVLLLFGKQQQFIYFQF